MPLNRAFIGRSYGPSEVYEVSREKIRDFAVAIGDPNPAYLDPAAAKALGHPDVVAPPTFATVLGFRLGSNPLADPDLGLDYALVVHSAQRYSHRRPIRAGDRLVATQTVTSIRDVGQHELLEVTSELATVDGEQVCTAVSALVSRGTAASRRDR